MKIGLILAQYNNVDYLKSCLDPWIKYKKENKDNELLIACIDGKFQEFDDGTKNLNSQDGSLQQLLNYLHNNEIDFLRTLLEGQSLKEHEVRNYPLKFLLEQNCNYIISIGTDEIFIYDQIIRIINYVKKDEFICYYNIQYKNFVFDKNHYILGFNPPRIWKTKYLDWQLKEFYWDDDILYVRGDEKMSYREFPNKLIPNVLVDHLTWCDPKRSQQKINYQEKHFAHGAGCSFKVVNDKVEFNLDYYKKINQMPPIVYEQ